MTYYSPAPLPVRAQEPRTSAAAVASLIFAVVGALGGCLICGLPPLVAIITGHVGVARTRGGELKGHGLALAGLIIGYVLLLPTALAIVYLLFYSDGGPDFVEGLRDFVANIL